MPSPTTVPPTPVAETAADRVARLLGGLDEALDGLVSYRAVADHLGGSAVTYTIVNGPVRAYEMVPEVVDGNLYPHTILVGDMTWTEREDGSWFETVTPGDLPFCSAPAGDAACDFAGWVWLDDLAGRAGTFATVAEGEELRGVPTVHLQTEDGVPGLTGTLDVWVEPVTGVPLRISFVSTDPRMVGLGRVIDIDRINDAANRIVPPEG
jgi:hypothetical protein